MRFASHSISLGLSRTRSQASKEGIMFRLSRFSGEIVVGFSLTLFLPSAAHSDCTRWTAPGVFYLVQTNGFAPRFILHQTGTTLEGTATYYAKAPWQQIDGSVDGSFRGNSFELTARWKNGSVGIYTGRVNSDGFIEGKTYDRNHPESQASWYSDQSAVCLPSPAAPPAPKPPAATPQTPPRPFESLPPGGAGKLLQQMKP